MGLRREKKGILSGWKEQGPGKWILRHLLCWYAGNNDKNVYNSSLHQTLLNQIEITVGSTVNCTY